ncbi:MAG: RNA polymerase sigma factor RpoH [Rhodospirillaceae bacterium]|nr:RNA polymerase sigma factor RpoH [Rhodospirillaceae bacterium]|tara:strand:+ start:37 stop:927 length:891 start_codon:yes stop_codon:yes gene_type:complete
MASNIPSVSNDGDLSSYLRAIRKFPMLSIDEEFTLAKRLQDDGDTDAAHKLVTSHLRLVAKIAMGYRGYGLPLSELISEGNIGMMQAVKKFDPDKGFRLATYAMWWIRASIQEYILHSWSLVKMGTTAAQKKLFFNLKKLKGQINAMEEGDLHPNNLNKIADTLNVSKQEVINMNRRLSSGDRSLNTPMHLDSDGDWIDWLEDDSPNQETIVSEKDEFDKRYAVLKDSMDILNERERRIIFHRRLTDEPLTLEQLSEEYNISRERVRQIEVRAFEKLQEAVKKSYQANNLIENSSI